MQLRGRQSPSALAVGTRPVDWLVASVLLLVAEFEIWVEPIFENGLPGPRPALSVLAGVALAPLVWRRRFPLGALAIVVAGLLAIGAVGADEQSGFAFVLALLLAVYAVAAQADVRKAVLGGLLVLAGSVVYEWLAWAEGDTLVDVAVPFLLLAAAWVAGREVGHQRLRAAELAQRTALLEHGREREAQLAVAEERARIARELHDVVAHGVGIMGVQAAAARRTLEPRQDSQREALLTVERIGREALAELQRMLGVLRSNGQAVERAPLPTLARLRDLAEEHRRAGLQVELAIEGEVRPHPPGLELSAYRIVQEALTNARKHAPGAAARVTVRHVPGALELTVSDGGPGPAADGSVGHGLVGMRERAALHGGELRAGPGPDGGFLVEARFPTTEPAL